MLLPHRTVVVTPETYSAGSRDVETARFVQRELPAIPPEVFEQDEFRDEEAVARRWGNSNDAGLLQRSANTAQRFVGQLIGRWTISSIEISDEATPHLEISLAV